LIRDLVDDVVTVDEDEISRGIVYALQICGWLLKVQALLE
jgi:threonine dehydratase